MFTFPPLPSWQGLHPLIVHFPIALLLVAPLLMLIGALVPSRRARPYLYSAALLILLGTAAIFVAVETGEAAGRLAERTPAINATLEVHKHLAERTRTMFATLSVLLLMILVAPRVMKRENRIFTTALPLLFLMLYLAGALSLVNTAHNGGRLVHEFGVHAIVAPSAAPASPTGTEEARGSDGD